MLGKITIDNSVRYISKNEKTQERDSKPKTIKKNSLAHKQGEGISQNNKKCIKIVAAGGFGIPKWMMIYYF